MLKLYENTPKQHRITEQDIIFEIVTYEDGQQVGDIRDEAQNIAYANRITRLIKRLVDDDPENLTQIHMSLAGGRKSMSSYDHTAMMYFGRVQDELSHVLVDPTHLEGCGDKYENGGLVSRGFWWPGQPETEVSNREGVRFPTSVESARVDLVSIPFARLNIRLQKGTPPEALDHGLLTQWVESYLTADTLKINLSEETVSYGGEIIELSPYSFSLFSVMALAQSESWRGVGPYGIGDNHVGWIRQDNFLDPQSSAVTKFCDFWERSKRFGDDGDKTLCSLLKHKPAGHDDLLEWETFVRKGVQTVKNRLQSELQKSIKNAFLTPRLLPQNGPQKEARYGLTIPADKIFIIGV
ncbi:MAG: TIGR02584 family CRISPR-associated protein [Marinosulfonomonas sp.]|nr:TIGR02584 family CRISPR-associated protein [Marinosulfonomonas sp.]